MIKLKPIASQIILEAELKTYGDLKGILNSIKKNQKQGAIVSKGKEVALDTVLGFIPGASAAKTAYDFFKAATQKPDTKKTDTWLDNLDIDDQVSAIVDDTVENGFLEDLVKSIESESDDTELEADFNMNKKLQDYLADKYDDRTVSMKA
jgi:hypothetical protein